MATSILGSHINPLHRWINDSVKDVLPRKYKRTAFITSLIYLLDDNQDITSDTFKKIIKLFEIGLVNERSLRYSYHARKYIWGDLKKTATINFNGQSLTLAEAVEKYRTVSTDNDTLLIERIINAIFAKMPDFIRYGSEKLMRHDLFYVLFFLKHKDAI